MSDETVTREQIAARQADRLPEQATRWLLQVNYQQALEADAVQDAVELAAAEVVASGRDFSDVPEQERKQIMARNIAACVERNRRFLAMLLDDAQN